MPPPSAVMLCAWSIVGPGVDEVVQLVSWTLSRAHVTVTLQGVGVADVTEVKAALDQLFDGSLSGGVGNPAGEVRRSRRWLGTT